LTPLCTLGVVRFQNLDQKGRNNWRSSDKTSDSITTVPTKQYIFSSSKMTLVFVITILPMSFRVSYYHNGIYLNLFVVFSISDYKNALIKPKINQKQVCILPSFDDVSFDFYCNSLFSSHMLKQTFLS